MKLFDEVARTETRVKKYGEGAFAYLNSTARPEFEETRALLEAWFSHYPKEHESDLRQRFRSKLDVQHIGAFWELLLHELLLRLGCTIRIHPDVPNSSARPDFLIETEACERCYMEAVTVPGASDEDVGRELIMNSIYDALDKEIVSTDFFLWMDVAGIPERQHSIKRLAAEVSAWLASLDADSITQLHSASGFDALPRRRFESDGWVLSFRPIPKRLEARAQGGVRPVGVRMGQCHTVDHRTPIRDALIEKARAYGDLGHPYVIAVNALERIDELDVEEALFGQENYVVQIRPGQPLSEDTGYATRNWDGAFMNARGERISASFVARQVQPMTFDQSWYLLWHNPRAMYRYDCLLTRFDQAMVVENEKRVEKGVHPSTILLPNA
jgi:hypothetical protein